MKCPCCKTARFAVVMKLRDGYYECGCGYAISIASATSGKGRG